MYKPMMAKRWAADTKRKLPKSVASGTTAKTHKKEMESMGKKMKKKVESML